MSEAGGQTFCLSYFAAVRQTSSLSSMQLQKYLFVEQLWPVDIANNSYKLKFVGHAVLT
jgi:hypothetical protein